MEKYWLRREGNPALIIFALGWSADHRLVEHINPAGYDLLCLYDYRTLEPVTEAETANYRTVTLLAWSFGVWVAEQLLRAVSLTRAVALNGSPFPVHDTHGIPVRSFAVTLRGIASTGIEGFNRRAYGEHLDRIARLQPRPFDALYEELQILHARSLEPYTPVLRWEKAIVGSRDLIFPPANLTAYWGERTVPMDLPHYPFGDAAFIYRLLEEAGQQSEPHDFR